MDLSIRKRTLPASEGGKRKKIRAGGGKERSWPPKPVVFVPHKEENVSDMREGEEAAHVLERGGEKEGGPGYPYLPRKKKILEKRVEGKSPAKKYRTWARSFTSGKVLFTERGEKRGVERLFAEQGS